MHWAIDLQRSKIGFRAHSFNYIVVDGTFERFEGAFHLDENDLAQSWVHVEIDAHSVRTDNPKRDEYICSADLLDVVRFPSITFRSTKVEANSPRYGLLTGDLTIRDVTRPVTLSVEASPLHGGDTASYTAKVTIDRRDWGMTYNEVPGMVGFKIELHLQLVAERQPEPTSDIADPA